MNHDTTQASATHASATHASATQASAIRAAIPARKLLSLALPAEVADSGLIRIGAAVGRPVTALVRKQAV